MTWILLPDTAVRFSEFSTSSVMFLMTSAVVGSSVAPVSLRCCERRPSDDFLRLLDIILLGVVGYSVLALSFSGEATFSSSRILVLTSYTELLSILFCKLFFRRVSLNAFSLRAPWVEKEFSAWLNVAQRSARHFSSASHSSSHTSSIYASRRSQKDSWC